MAVKRLYLSRNKMIGGVAGGMAEYFDLDPTIMRLLWLLFAFMGAGVIAYILAMLVIPAPPDSNQPGDPNDPYSEVVAEQTSSGSVKLGSEESQRSLGFLLIGLGLLWLLRLFIPTAIIWPFALIGVGIVLFFKGVSRR